MRIAPSPVLALIAALGIVTAAVYWPSPLVYIQEWSNVSNTTFTHGWLILAIGVGLVWRSRRAIEAAPIRACPRALVVLLVCSLVWLVAYRASIEDLHITIFPALFWLAALAALGWPVARLLLFPVAFFYFAVPSWAQLGPPLQQLAVLAMRGLFSLTGPPVRIVGMYIHIPNGVFVIEEGCSGLHFMIVGLAVAALHGELRGDRIKTRLAQLALMAVLALLANWVRVYTVIEAGYLTDMQSYLVRVSHYWFGWGVFAVALVPFFWISHRLAPQPVPYLPAPQPAVASPWLVPFATTLTLLVALPAGSTISRSFQLPPRAPESRFVAPAGWSAQSDNYMSWQPIFPGADLMEQFGFHGSAGQQVWCLRVFYGVQRQGAELVGSGSTVFGKLLKVRGEGVAHSSRGEFRESRVVDRAGVHSLLWWRYEVAGHAFLAPLGSQVWYGIRATLSKPPAALVAYLSPCTGDDCEPARRSLLEFTNRPM
jgi:exosortase